MFNRFSVAILATVLIASSAAAVADSSRAQVKRGATTTTSVAQTVEGNRYVVTTTVKSPKHATSITLQKLDAPDYSFQDPEWDDVRTVAVRGRAKIRTVVVATEKNTERYRAVVRYKKAKPFTSKPTTVKVWRWIPLSEYDAYYETGGTGFGTFSINGRSYRGFGPYYYLSLGSWESRFTPGRNCKALKGVLGLDDDSGDGASGTVTVTADDRTIYTSRSLTPGMSLPVTIPLATPYRLGLLLTDTTPGGTDGHDDIEAYPSIGDPLLLCTGV